LLVLRYIIVCIGSLIAVSAAMHFIPCQSIYIVAYQHWIDRPILALQKAALIFCNTDQLCKFRFRPYILSFMLGKELVFFN
jgi:hypothetical protein